jgi:hypothetical protein
MVALPDDRLILVCAERRTHGSSVAAYVSADGGVTWNSAGTLRESEDHRFYYPNTAPLPDGQLLTVYMTAQPSLVRLVEMTRWQPP